MKTAVIRARIPEDLKQAFESVAASHNLGLSQALRMLMSDYVARQAEFDRRHEETLEALDDLATGRSVSGDKVMNWLASWGSETEQDAPT